MQLLGALLGGRQSTRPFAETLVRGRQSTRPFVEGPIAVGTRELATSG
jgi:hypothetical protein